MNRKSSANWIRFMVSQLFLGSLAWGQLNQAAPAPSADPHPYQSQSFVRLKDGTVEVFAPQTVDYTAQCDASGKNCKEVHEHAAWIFEKEPGMGLLQKSGSAYFVSQDHVLATVAATGALYVKGDMEKFIRPFHVGTTGGIYFLKQENAELVTIDSYGFFNETGFLVPNLKAAGGNYFIQNDGTLTTIKASGIAPGNFAGQFYHRFVPKDVKPEDRKYWVFNDVDLIGGQLFSLKDGTVVSISSIDGLSYGPNAVGAKPVKMGGNYFIGDDKQIYTTNNDGALMAHGVLPAEPVIYGYSYLIYGDGAFTFIAADGSLHSEAVWVSANGALKKWVRNLNQDLGIPLDKIER